MLKLGLMGSGNGSNVQAVLDACAAGTVPAAPVIVISNNSDSGVLARARRAGVATAHLSGRTHPEPAALDGAIVATLARYGVQLVVLAGYMKRLGPQVLGAYAGRIVNIHPSLLPRHGGPGMYGLRVHQAVLRDGAAMTGATVHLVDAEYDSGPILAQVTVPVREDDTPESLAARVLEHEHALLVETLARIAGGDIELPPPR